MEILNLLAKYGDAIVVKTTKNGKPFTIVIDGGPVSTNEEIASYITNTSATSSIIPKLMAASISRTSHLVSTGAYL